ncbi:MAG TPA: PEGA domain-containing protein [bacterium]
MNRLKNIGNLWAAAGFMLVLYVFGCSKAQLPLTPEPGTTLEVIAITTGGANVDSARVFLNGQFVGFTPYENQAMQAGVHALRVMKDGYQVYTHQLLIEEDQDHNIEALLTPMPVNEGELLVTVNQDSAMVTVRDSQNSVIIQTEQRVSSHILQGGAYVVSGEKSGFPLVVKAIEVVSGKVTTVNLELLKPGTTPQAPTLQFSIQEDTVKAGTPFNLRWESNGHQVIIDQGVGVRGPNGSERMTSNVLGLKIFTATAYGDDNLVTERIDSVYVAANTSNPPPAPTLQFAIQEDSVTVGEPFMLSWQSNGSMVVIDQGVGVRGPNGSEKISSSVTGLKIFTAAAYNEDNMITEKKDTVYVAPKTATAPALTFEVLADSIVYGEPVTIQWESDGSQVVIDNGIGARGPQGSEEVLFHSTGKKTLVATAYGEDNLRTTRSASVYVKEAPMPMQPVVMISTTRRVTVNTPATISWVSQNADYLVVDYVTNPQGEGTKDITFSTPGIRIVTATAFNRAGYASASDTIEVVEPQVATVEDILISTQVGVRADKGAASMELQNAATFDVQTAGRYRLLAEVWYNSGDEQRNESFYLQIRDGSGSVKLPKNANAGNNKVVEDDPGDPHTVSQESGEFKLAVGTHAIDLYHYARISAQYPQFLNGPIDGAESVKVLGFKLVYLGN